MLDAIEESIRDIMECFIEHLDANLTTKKSENGVGNNNHLKSLPETNFDEKMNTETQKLTELNFRGRITSQEVEDELVRLVENNQRAKKLDIKFKYVNKILTEFANSNHYITEVRYMRLYFLMVLAIGR